MSSTITLQITNCITRVNLNYTIPKATKAKVKFLRYITATDANDIMVIKLRGFNQNLYIDKNNNMNNCLKILPLPSTATSIYLYDNLLSNTYDVELLEKQDNSVSSLDIEVLINNSYSSDISISNPLYLELEIA